MSMMLSEGSTSNLRRGKQETRILFNALLTSAFSLISCLFCSGLFLSDLLSYA